MLPLCCSFHPVLSLRVGTRVFYPLQIIEGRPFCLPDGIHAQNMSFRTHATKFMHSFLVERPDKSSSTDSSIFSPHPNEFDDIVRGFSNKFIDSQPENLSCLSAERTGLRPLAEDLKCMESSNISVTEVLHGEVGNDITNGISSGSVSADPLASSYTDLLSIASPSQNEFQNLPDSLDQSFSALSESTSSGPSLVTNDMATNIPGSPVAVSDTVKVTSEGILNLKQSVEHVLSEFTESVDTSIGKVKGAVESSYNSFVLSFSGGVKNVRESFDSALVNLFSSAGNSEGQANNEFTGFSVELKENVYRTGTVATDILRWAIITVEDSLSNLASYVVYSYGSAKSLLPPDFRNALNLSEENVIQILRPVGAAFQQVYINIEGLEEKLGLDPSDPIVPVFLFLGSSATIGISYWLFTYGGYSGDLTPELTMELLKSEDNAVLIDVRPEDLRGRDGIPDLRRGTRSKYASVTLPELDGSLRKLLDGKDINDALLAVVIRNLKIVKDGSKVIVMDAGGGQSKAIARSLKKLGVKSPYLVNGGFQSWVRKGLRIKELKPETTLTVLNEDVEAILEDIRPTPTLVIGYGLGILAASYALLEWEKTLQVIGLIGLGQTLYRRFASYEDSKDFKQDVRLLLTPVRLGAQGVTWAAGKLEPNKIGLPTSPSSTAVQDRVLQAAAKHESQPSDGDDNEGLPSESSGQTNENLDLSEA